MRFRARLAQNLSHCPRADTEALSNACDSESVLISLIAQLLYSTTHFLGDAPEASGRVASHVIRCRLGVLCNYSLALVPRSHMSGGYRRSISPAPFQYRLQHDQVSAQTLDSLYRDLFQGYIVH